MPSNVKILLVDDNPMVLEMLRRELSEITMVHTATENLVHALETASHTALHRVQVLDTVERRRVLLEWNDTTCEVPAATVPERALRCRVTGRRPSSGRLWSDTAETRPSGD